MVVNKLPLPKIRERASLSHKKKFISRLGRFEVSIFEVGIHIQDGGKVRRQDAHPQGKSLWENQIKIPEYMVMR